MYCYLKSRTGQEIPSPCSKEWFEEVCKPLGVSVLQSHQAWAKLQEMGLIFYDSGDYILRDPQSISDKHVADETKQTIYADVEAQFGRPLSGAEIYQLEILVEEYPLELIATAARFAVQSQAFSLPYIKQVLLNWKAKGIKSVEQAEADHQEFSMRKAKRHAQRGSASPKRKVEIKAPDAVNYDDEELILKRMLRAAKGDVVNHGW